MTQKTKTLGYSLYISFLFIILSALPSYMILQDSTNTSWGGLLTLFIVVVIYPFITTITTILLYIKNYRNFTSKVKTLSVILFFAHISTLAIGVLAGARFIYFSDISILIVSFYNISMLLMLFLPILINTKKNAIETENNNTTH